MQLSLVFFGLYFAFALCEPQTKSDVNYPDSAALNVNGEIRLNRRALVKIEEGSNAAQGTIENEHFYI